MFSAVQHVGLRQLRAAVRRPVLLTFSLVQPLLWMTFFGFLFQRTATPDMLKGLDYLTFVTPGIALLSILFGASQSGVSLIRDIQTGFLGRVLCTATPAAAFLFGKVLADVLRLMVQGALVLGLGHVLGASLNMQYATIPSTLVAIAAFALLMCSLSCLLAALARAPEVMGAYVHLVNMPVLFTSTALIPARHMPPWLSALAQYNPMTIAAEALRSVCLGWGGPSAQSILGLVIVSGLMLIFASLSLSHAARME